MAKIISIRDFRAQISDIADQVEEGESFIVLRRSKQSFKITPIGIDDQQEGEWETVIDFTKGGKTKGEKVETVLKALSKMNKHN